MLGTLGGSRSLAGGTWTGTHLFGGMLQGDEVAAAGGGACGAVPGLGGRRPCCAGRPAGASCPWTRLLTCPLLSTAVEAVESLLQFIDKVWTSLRLCSDAVSQWEVPQTQFIV